LTQKPGDVNKKFDQIKKGRFGRKYFEKKDKDKENE